MAPTGGSNRLSRVVPAELSKDPCVPVEGYQLCWAYLAVWLPWFIRDTRVEEGIVKLPSKLPTLLRFSPPVC